MVIPVHYNMGFNFHNFVIISSSHNSIVLSKLRSRIMDSLVIEQVVKKCLQT